MAERRRWLRVVSRVSLALVALLVVALVVTQTPWFRDWLRRTAMRQAARVIEGQLVIGRLEGSLFTGVTLRDVSVVQEGAPVVNIERVAVSYGLRELLSDGRLIAHLQVDRPVIRMVRTATGWNVARLLKPRTSTTPSAGRPTFSLPDIVLTDGVVVVEAAGVEPSAAIPRRIEGLQFTGAVHSIADVLRIDIRSLSLRAEQPDLTLVSVTGQLVDDASGWRFDALDVTTGESRVRVDGALPRTVDGAPRTFALDVDSPGLSLPEIGRFVPAVAHLDVRPSFTSRITGTLDALGVDIDLTSDAGGVVGPLVIDTTGPTRGVSGTVDVTAVNLAVWLHDPEAAGRISGAATFDLRFPSATPGVRLDGTFRFKGPEVSAYGYAATDVTAQGRLRGPRIELDARAAAYGGRATARGHIDRPGPAQRGIRLALAGRVQNVDLRRLPARLRVPALETSVTGAYTVDGPISALRATGTLDASTVEGAAIAEGLVATFDRQPGGYRFDAIGEVTGLDLQRLGRALDVGAMQGERYAGVVNGTFTVEGTQRADAPLHLNASGTVLDTRVWNGHLPEMTFDATLDGRTLDVTAKGRVDEYDLADLTGIAALTGTLAGDVDTVVRFANLDEISVRTVAVDGTVTLIRPTLMDVPFEQVTADVRLDQGVLHVGDLQGTGEGFTLTGQGPIALGETGRSNFAYRLEAASIVNPAKVANLPLTGAATTEGTITGPRGEFRATGTLEGTTVSYGEIVSAGDVKARYTVEVPDFDAERLRVTSSVSASTVVVAGLPFEATEGEVTYVPDELTFDATARDATRTVHGAGTMTLEEGRQVVALRELSVQRDAVRWALGAGQTATLTITPEAVDLAPVSLVNGAQSIDLDGRIAIAEGATNGLTVTAAGVDIGDALILAGQEWDVDGTAALTARIGGTRAVPTVSGRVGVRDGRYREMAIAAVEATVDDDGRMARVDALVRQSDQAYLTAKGVVPRTLLQPPPEGTAVPATEDRLDLEIHSTQIDLALAEGLTDQASELSGRAQLDIRLTNTGRVPVVDGEVTLSDAGFLVTATGVRYGNVDGTLEFAGDTLIVRQLSAESQEGRTLQVSGEVGLRNAQRGSVALSITGEGVRVLDNEFGEIDLDSTLTVTGTVMAPVIEGDLVVTNGRLDVDAILPRVATNTYATESSYQGIPTYTDEDALPVVPNIMGTPEDDDMEPGDAPRPSRATFVYDDLSLNVRVRIPDNLVLRGRDVEVGRSSIGDVNVTMGGDFRVAKTPGESLVLIGAVNTVRGTYSYQGRRFDIARDGQVLFQGDGTTNPSLDITAERVIQGVEARVRIQGTARNPTLSLSSDPPLDQADVLALIVFNQPVNQLGTGQQNSLAQRAGGIAAGFAVSPIAQALGDTLDLDLFDVETTDPSGRVNPALVIGQQVDQNLFVKFRQQFGNQQVSQFLLEYRLADFLRLQANFAEGEGLARGNRSLTQRIERYGTDLVFYFAF